MADIRKVTASQDEAIERREEAVDSQNEEMESPDEETESPEETIKIPDGEMSREKILQELRDYIHEVFDIIESSEAAEDYSIIRLIEYVTVPRWPLDLSRKTVSYICRKIFNLEANKTKSLAKLVIDMLRTQPLKFDHQLAYLRENLAEIYVSENKFPEAAALLVVNFLRSDEEEYLANHKLCDCMKIANLYIEANDLPQAMDYLNQASHLQTNKTSDYVKLRLKFLDAKFRVHMSDHLEATRRYIDLSNEKSLPMEDRVEALTNAMTCILFAKDDVSRTQSLDTFAEDKRVDCICEFLGGIRLSTFELRLGVSFERDALEEMIRENANQEEVEMTFLTSFILDIRDLISLNIVDRLLKSKEDVESLAGQVCEMLGIHSISENSGDNGDAENGEDFVDDEGATGSQIIVVEFEPDHL